MQKAWQKPHWSCWMCQPSMQLRQQTMSMKLQPHSRQQQSASSSLLHHLLPRRQDQLHHLLRYLLHRAAARGRAEWHPAGHSPRRSQLQWTASLRQCQCRRSAGQSHGGLAEGKWQMRLCRCRSRAVGGHAPASPQLQLKQQKQMHCQPHQSETSISHEPTATLPSSLPSRERS